MSELTERFADIIVDFSQEDGAAGSDRRWRILEERTESRLHTDDEGSLYTAIRHTVASFSEKPDGSPDRSR